ncbi:transcriptional regulator, AlpA family [Sulfitobacter marinus]|uniref:Transcriptional regulator, AlpA family n=1 Tax=Sulfitobacter marinus TaxID=394264 RepID=A0A1I6RTY1_9RHOB|nr:helix-turn-helix domain-containing protein [Sulfitobacter marinus]SFS68086.1 transcriptional regulator, AlpA family [Sulfitobacter marinus]
MQHQEILERLERIETAISTPAKEYLNIKQAAEFIGVSRQTLDLWRMNAEGPAVHRVGTRVLYSVADLRAYMDERRHEALQ